ncbi:MAG: protein kinase, partial [Proteobacteria bacterium]|nr:protein kinase [Pseudomonadota bacterium]
ALPCAPIGGNEEDGFCVDEDLLSDIARLVGQPLPDLLAHTVQTMARARSRHVAKMFIYGCLSGDERLIGSLEGPFHDRARFSRQWLTQTIGDLFPELTLRPLQTGDRDNYNPISASLWLAEGRDGSKVVVKENLRLPVDYSRLDGYSAEGEMLDFLDLSGVVRLDRIARAADHELLVLQFVEGEPLSRYCSPETLLPRKEVAQLGAQLAQTLAALHDRGVLYLDVKAKNVLWDGRRTTLVDFGMAQRGTDKASSLLSTPAFVPPEMVLNFQATAAADVFQLGLLLFLLFTGRHPFATTGFRTGDAYRESELLRYGLANLYEEPRLDLLAHHEPLLRSMLQRDPRLRPSVNLVAQQLRGEP